jgi:HTH-type transcriptional regulator, sugar sensing transcriptional regulator
MEIKQTLEQFGLEGKKADVYLAALELGSSSVIEIAKKAQIKRTTCYDILQDLVSEGLISQTLKGKKRLFIGENPEKIADELKRKYSAFSEIMPLIKAIQNTQGTKPKIRFYEGIEGLKECYLDTLKYSGEILALGSEHAVKVLSANWLLDYINQRVKKGIRLKAIVADSKLVQEEFLSKDQEQLRTSKIINPGKYPFSIEINIYGFQKVFFMSPNEQMGLIIEGTEIHKTMKSMFELIWDLLPEKKL